MKMEQPRQWADVFTYLFCFVLLWLWLQFQMDSCDLQTVSIIHHDGITRASSLLNSPANWLIVEEFIHTYYTGRFPSQRVGDVDNVSISRRQHVSITTYTLYYMNRCITLGISIHWASSQTRFRPNFLRMNQYPNSKLSDDNFGIASRPRVKSTALFIQFCYPYASCFLSDHWNWLFCFYLSELLKTNDNRIPWHGLFLLCKP